MDQTLNASEKELNMIRGKMIVGKASIEEVRNFLEYVSIIEGLVEYASEQDFYGTEGWRHWVGLE
jgi:hypothetical protein